MEHGPKPGLGKINLEFNLSSFWTIKGKQKQTNWAVHGKIGIHKWHRFREAIVCTDNYMSFY